MPSRHFIFRAWVIGAALLAVGLATGCAGRKTKAQARAAEADKGPVIRIAAVWSWETRREMRFGEGLDLAVDEVNASGGVGGRRLEIVRFDDRESVDEGRLVAQRIAADPSIVAVVGHLQSYVAVPAAEIYDRAGLVMISPTSTDLELTSRGYQQVFRVAMTGADIGRQMAEYASGQGLRRMAIYYVRNGYGRGLANAFEERAAGAGLLVVARQSYDADGRPSDAVFEQTAREWKEVEFDGVFVAGEVPSAARFVVIARREGIGVPILGGDAMAGSPLITEGGRAVEGTIVASFFHPAEPRTAVSTFVGAFKKRYGMEPDAGAAVAYDSIRVLAQAMREGESAVPAVVARQLRGLKEWPGVTGPFTFDPEGNRRGQRIVTVAVTNGRFEYVAPSRQMAHDLNRQSR
jgi:branched-chain amino acid transport system substrate-binding protein